MSRLAAVSSLTPRPPSRMANRMAFARVSMARTVPPFKRIPRHVGLIPDGNRRWARIRGLSAGDGYAAGIEPGLRVLEACRELGIREISIYGFTKENVRRPAEQVESFCEACSLFAMLAVERGAALLVVGDSRSPIFPPALEPFARERASGDLRVNLLVNYGWQWDLRMALQTANRQPVHGVKTLGSVGISRIELVVRWGGRRRLSGFLPMQCAYADLCVLDTLWPDAGPSDLEAALDWYQTQDVTQGG